MSAPCCNWWGWRRWRSRRAAGHGFEKDVFQGIAAVVHAPDLNRVLPGQAVKLAEFNGVGKNYFQTSCAETGALASQLLHRLQKTIGVFLDDLHLQKLEISLALFLQIAQRGDLSLFEDEHLVTTILDIAQ